MTVRNQRTDRLSMLPRTAVGNPARIAVLPAACWPSGCRVAQPGEITAAFGYGRSTEAGRTEGTSMKRALAVVGGLAWALLASALVVGSAWPAHADDTPPYDCTNSNGGTSSFCQRTHSLGLLGWTVLIAIVVLVLIAIGWTMRARRRRRDRLEHTARRGWRRLLGRRRHRVIERY
jgi:Family of unknown function (DUF6338)